MKIIDAFVQHPKATGETYGQHWWFTVGMASNLLFAGVTLLIHGIFPFFFTRTASKQIERMYVIMKSRIPQARRDELDLDLGAHI